jgi:hypothetical protein
MPHYSNWAFETLHLCRSPKLFQDASGAPNAAVDQSTLHRFYLDNIFYLSLFITPFHLSPKLLYILMLRNTPMIYVSTLH